MGGDCDMEGTVERSHDVNHATDKTKVSRYEKKAHEEFMQIEIAGEKEVSGDRRRCTLPHASWA